MIYNLLLLISLVQIDHDLIEKNKTDFSGYYVIVGTTDKDKKYEGIAVVEKRESIYIIQWNIGATSFMGIGQYRKPFLAVGWLQKDVRGLTVYKINNLVMEGNWCTLPGDGQLHPESLTFLRPLVTKEK